MVADHHRVVFDMEFDGVDATLLNLIDLIVVGVHHYVFSLASKVPYNDAMCWPVWKPFLVKFSRLPSDFSWFWR